MDGYIAEWTGCRGRWMFASFTWSVLIVSLTFPLLGRLMRLCVLLLTRILLYIKHLDVLDGDRDGVGSYR